MKRGYFFAFEGMDGAGKDTQISRFCDELLSEKSSLTIASKYHQVVRAREPTKANVYGIEVSQRLKKGNLSAQEAAELFVKDRLEHCKDLEHDLSRGRQIICNRFDVSTLAYQMTQGVDFETLYEMHTYGQEGGCLIPDLTLFLKIPVGKAMERIQRRQEHTKVALEQFETYPFQKSLYENYTFVLDTLRDRGRTIAIINGDQDPASVAASIVAAVNAEGFD